MKFEPHKIILKPHLTEKTVRLAEQGQYVFFVAPEANKIEVARALEALYNQGKRKKDRIQVVKVNLINVKGKPRRTNWRIVGRKPDRKKAIITLAEGQRLEGYGA